MSWQLPNVSWEEERLEVHALSQTMTVVSCLMGRWCSAHGTSVRVGSQNLRKCRGMCYGLPLGYRPAVCKQGWLQARTAADKSRPFGHDAERETCWASCNTHASSSFATVIVHQSESCMHQALQDSSGMTHPTTSGVCPACQCRRIGVDV